MPITVESSAPAGAVAEGFILDGLDLNPLGGTFQTTALSIPPPKKKPEWAEYTDGDGALLVRDPLFENRTIDATVEVFAASRDAGHTAVGQIVDKLEEAERHALGIPLVWTPANSTKSLTFYVLSGEVTEYPIEVESGYFADAPVLRAVLNLTGKPFGYGAEVAGPSTSGSGPLLILSLPSIPGDVPAESRLVVTDTATQPRDFAVWGLEWRHQNGSDLLLTQNELTATGFAGTSTTRSGSVSTNVFRGTLTTSPVAVCGTGNQPHVGVYRVFCRYWASGDGVKLRLVYRDGNGPLTPLLYATPPEENSWFESDLGVITVSPKLLGTQRWQGQLEAYSDAGGDTIDIDYLELIPAGEGFGRARNPGQFYVATSFSARDEFDQSAGSLAGKTAPVGGVWAEAGDAVRFSVETTGKMAQRTEVSDASLTGAYAISGVAAFAAQASQIDFKYSTNIGADVVLKQAAVARYTDTSNWVRAEKNSASGSLGANVRVVKNVAGVNTFLGIAGFEFTDGTWYTIRLMADASGRWYVWVFATGGIAGSPLLAGVDAALATGGALATGKPGFYDEYPNATAVTRNYDNFVAFAPTSDAAIHSGQSIEFRHDETIREDSSGTYWGGPPEYRGAPFFIPPAGDENRTSRVAVMARRHDLETLQSDGTSDTYSVQAHYTPRYLVVPR